MEIKIINAEKYLESISDMRCGKTRFAQIESSDFAVSPFTARPLDDYKLPEKFPACCESHQERKEVLNEWFEKFPSCCARHKKLLAASWFSKNDYHDVVDKVLLQSQYTWIHIHACLEKDDWYEDITEYIDYNYKSFGSLPAGFGCAVGLDRYLNFIENDIDSIKENYPAISKFKIDRLLQFVRNYYKPIKNSPNIDLNVLDKIYKNWLDLFPFGIPYFAGLKEYYQKHFPILKDQPTTNRYTGLSAIKVKTQQELVDWLVSTTRSLLQKINTADLVDQGVIGDSKKYAIYLINESHRINQMALLGDFSTKEKKYVKILKQWLTNEKHYFKELLAIVKADPISNPAWGPLVQLMPFEDPVIFEQFVCDLYNALYPDHRYELYGKKGDRQKGLDVLSTSATDAIQCKKKDLTRQGLVRELKKDFESDIQNALELDFKIKRLTFVSTFQDNATLIEHLQKLKEKYRLDFDVVYIGWGSLSSKVQAFPVLLNRYFKFNLPT